MGDDIIPACLVVMLFENCSVLIALTKRTATHIEEFLLAKKLSQTKLRRG